MHTIDYLELHKRAIALGWIPSEITHWDEDGGGNSYEEEVWVFLSRLGKTHKDLTVEMGSLDALLRYYANKINEEFESKFTVRGKILQCPRCCTPNRINNLGDYRCTFCGMRYSKRDR